jgi:hypothetical protein
MNSSPLEYLRTLVAGVPALDSALNRCLQSWGAETPPATIAFAEVGDAITENLAALPNEARQKIFAAVEEGMVSQDSALRTAMATGLVEALVASADKKPNLWIEFESLLGVASLKHATAWRNFGR